ncbi:MAG: hypothetical protein ACRCVT_00645 [Leadbetterella sp.]
MNPSPKSQIHAKNIESLDEFSKIDALYQSCFEESSIPTETLRSWWQTYTKGLIGLFEGDQLIGGLSIWPIDNTTFEAIFEGNLREKDILDKNIDSKNKNKWYISEIAIQPQKRNFKYLPVLLNRTFEQLEEEISDFTKSQILAMSYSNQGASLMRKLGFVQELYPSQTMDKMALYVLNLQLHKKNKLP